jgi:AcrR family transcriptional regulator
VSPRSAEQNRALRDKRRLELLDAALLEFAERGFDRTTVSAIARRAGVSQGLVYHYFDRKEELLRANFERSMDAVRATLDEAAAAPPAERVGSLVRAALAGVRAELAFWRLTYAVRFQPPVVAALGADVQGWTAAVRATLTRAFTDRGAAEPALEAAVLFGLIDGIAQHYALE